MPIFEYPSQSAAKFNKELIDLILAKFLQIDFEECFISDESRLLDFIPYPDYRGKKLDSGEWEFLVTYFDLKQIRKELGVDSIVKVTKDQRDKYKKTFTQTLEDSEVV